MLKIKPTVTSNKALLNKYPIRRSGGLFLILVGITLLLSLVFADGNLVNQMIFVIGITISILSFFTVKYFSHGRPSRHQIIALGFALLLELILSILLINIVPQGTSERNMWLYGFIIVGIHFLPMAYSFGSIMLILGTGCLVNATLGLLIPQFPYEVFGIIDGMLKLEIGVILFTGIKRR